MRADREPADEPSEPLHLGGFARFFRADYRLVVAYLITRGATEADAEDAAMTTMMNLHQHLSRDHTVDHPRAYTLKIALREFGKARTRETKELAYAQDQALLELALTGPSHDSDPEMICQAQKQIERMLDALTKAQQEVMVLFALGVDRPRDIAEILGKPSQTVRQLLSQSLKRLRSTRAACEGPPGRSDRRLQPKVPMTRKEVSP